MTSVLEPFVTTIPEVDHARVAEVLASSFNLSGVLLPLPGERDQNFRLDAGDRSYVVKIANSGESAGVIEMQQAALRHLESVGCPISTPRVVETVDDRPLAVIDVGRASFNMWVQSLVDGDIGRTRLPARLIGRAAAELQHSLAGFAHPQTGRQLLWDARSLPVLGGLTNHVQDGGVRALIDGVIDRVEKTVLPGLAALPAQVIHNDLNPSNILVEGDRLVGVVDFGDMLHAPRIADLAVAASYQMARHDDPSEPLVELLTGYLERSELTEAELTVLLDLVSARLCQTIVIAYWRAGLHRENLDYILTDVDDAVRALTILEGEDRHELDQVVLRSAGFRSASSRDLVGRRRQSLAPGLRLMYEQPIRLARGEGVWLFDDQGNRYLDAYNNVVQLGHGHPAVVGAVRRAASNLNTNTRYLTAPPIELAESLAALLPDGLDVCYFTNSGSEANDLALRIARTYTGNHGVVVTAHAYHGVTWLTAAASPEEKAPPLPDWVATVPMPTDEPAAAISSALAQLAQHGHRPAALVYDTIFSSDGIHAVSGGFFDDSISAIREEGGLFVADEVQAGMGRVGSRMWGFAAAGQVPDIVTMGKPLGNGHPIGAVVTSPEIAEAFAAREHFFSTFGGSTASAAAGLAVVDATLALDLPGRAERVGSYLRDRLEQLVADSEQLTEVRGAGMFIGVEVADEVLAGELVERLRDRRVLIGRTGPAGNVLKIRPPLVFEQRHADAVVSALERSL